MKLHYVETERQIEEVRQLFVEYGDSLGFDLSFQDFDHELRNLPGDYTKPAGRLILAKEKNNLIGCVALRLLEYPICEMKRLYVRPQHRGRGIGKVLTGVIISEARKCGYDRMRLDTVPSMKEAIALYESLGFKQIPAYCRNPIQGAMYLELSLSSRDPGGSRIDGDMD